MGNALWQGAWPVATHLLIARHLRALKGGTPSAQLLRLLQLCKHLHSQICDRRQTNGQTSGEIKYIKKCCIAAGAKCDEAFAEKGEFRMVGRDFLKWTAEQTKPKTTNENLTASGKSLDATAKTTITAVISCANFCI